MIYEKTSIARYQALDKTVRLARKNPVIFVDCGNGFDPYLLFSLCKNRMEAKIMLKKTMVSRPFTFYQLSQIIFYDLLKTAKQNNTKQIIIFGLNLLFNDDSREEKEKFSVLNSILGKLISLEEKGLDIHHFLSEDRYTIHIMEVLNGKNRAIIQASS